MTREDKLSKGRDKRVQRGRGKGKQGIKNTDWNEYLKCERDDIFGQLAFGKKRSLCLEEWSTGGCWAQKDKKRKKVKGERRFPRGGKKHPAEHSAEGLCQNWVVRRKKAEEKKEGH